MNVLALDLGTKTGFAIWRDGAIISGTQKLRHNKECIWLALSGLCALVDSDHSGAQY